MKKIIYFTFLIASLTTYSQAPRGFYVTSGISQTELKSSDLLADPGIGFKGGLIVEMGYHETYNFQFELLFNQKTFNLKTVEGDYETVSETKYTSGSIDTGFYFNYYILKPEEDTFFFGPQIGLSLAFAGEFVPAGGSNSSDKNYLPYLLDDNSFMNMEPINYDAGLGLTGGYNDFRFDLRYTKGLNNRLKNVQTNSYDDSHTYTGPTLEGKLNTISLSISYIFWKRINKR